MQIIYLSNLAAQIIDNIWKLYLDFFHFIIFDFVFIYIINNKLKLGCL